MIEIIDEYMSLVVNGKVVTTVGTNAPPYERSRLGEARSSGGLGGVMVADGFPIGLREGLQ